MSIITEGERVIAIRQSDQGPVYEITLASGEVRPVLKEALDFRDLGDDTAHIILYQNILYGSFWYNIRAFLEANNIFLPLNQTPCHNCRGNKCNVPCSQEDKARRQNEQAAQLAA